MNGSDAVRIDLYADDFRAVDELCEDFWSTTVGRRLCATLTEDERRVVEASRDRPCDIEG